MLFSSRTRAAPAMAHESTLSLLAFVCAALLAWGWRVREEVYVSAGFGLGYALGILGTASMLLTLAYSLRKRLGLMRSWGPIPRWFSIHMALGLVGPVGRGVLAAKGWTSQSQPMAKAVRRAGP